VLFLLAALPVDFAIIFFENYLFFYGNEKELIHNCLYSGFKHLNERRVPDRVKF
jgi:hypothetical protein